ncbi:uncharacterized protein FOMMEDRAFT_95756 [Fomitiporia mediterranea MF3/22]|uniref:uncharacterized protein n=1 Tax=Fomitiporia mediterranea (strain MF3/22) TaxID=694068 RepID=UPI0004408C09|nr:uncharacterized protein FOMMEDRAFT_95756 [Fomitiporia mediterranea MF3/22]EJC98537.1 hypothetical protein FOMMEDRAFT_95756 [Fomitiporia mediterranea MF3/22]
MFLTIKTDYGLINTHTLIDSGCTGSYINVGFVKNNKLTIYPFKNPFLVFNTNSTSNDGGLLKDYVEVELSVKVYTETICLAVTTLVSSNIFLEYDWLNKHNLEIDWGQGIVSFTRCPDSCSMSLNEAETYPDVPEYLRRTDDDPTLVFTIPYYLEVYKDVFSKESFEQLLEH